MPQRKKKKHGSSRGHSSATVAQSPQHKQLQGDSSQRDVVLILQELDHLFLDSSSLSEADCVAGVEKADRALGECLKGGDLQCSILVKRAQLLKLMFERGYSTSGLSSQHSSPLDSCVADCQQVLSNQQCSVSSTNYQDAQALATYARKLLKEGVNDDQASNEAASGSQSQSSKQASTSTVKFEPERTQFKDISKINPTLLQDVINCYKKHKYVCKTCFIRYNRQEILVGGKPCRSCKNSTTVRVIPASKLCRNFRNLKYVAIPPPPKVLMAHFNRHKPFLFCRNSDHTLCYDRAKELWYAHSVEEMVVWTVERYWGCSFTDYVNNKHHLQSTPTGPRSKVTAKELDSFSDDLPEEFKFLPSKTLFQRGMASIPQHLLEDVVKCYRDMRKYCMFCFYKHSKRVVSPSWPDDDDSSVCKRCRKPWKGVSVIPSSSLCSNFGDFDFLPIAPCPQLKSKYTPFAYCRKDDHFWCFRVLLDFWYVHSVEEMVIWTVERENGCTFSQFVDKFRKPSLPPPGLTLPPSSPLSPLSPSSQLNSATSKSEEKSLTASGKVESGIAVQVSSPLPPSPSFSQVVSGPPLKSGPLRPNGPPGLSISGGPPQLSRTLDPTVSTGPPHLSGPPGPPISTGPPQLSRPPGPLISTGPPDLREPPKPRMSGGPPEPSHSTGLENNYHDRSHHKITDIDAISGASSTSNLDQAFIPNPNYKPSGPNSSAQIRDTFECLTQPVQSEHHRRKRRSSEDSFVTAFSQDTYSSLPANVYVHVGMSQDSEQSDLYESRTVHHTNASKARGRRNYEVAKSGKRKERREHDSELSATYNETSTHARHVGMNTVTGFSSSYSSNGYTHQLDTVNHRSGSLSFAAENFGKSSSAAKSQAEVFKFSLINYHTFSEVPLRLILAIATAFDERREVCRQCFYGERSLSYNEGALCGDAQHVWDNPITVIPGCKECANEPCFDRGDFLPVPPLPPIANIRKCSKTNHHKCFQRCLESNPKFAHSVEELVVWLVESEKDCSFADFIHNDLQSLCSLPAPDSTSQLNTGVSRDPHSLTTKVNHQPNTSECHVIPAQAHIPSRPPSSPIYPNSRDNQTTSEQPLLHSAPLQTQPRPLTPKYNARDVTFQYIKDIPQELLVGVSRCFEHRDVVCRQCFFSSGCTHLTTTKISTTCSKGHNWRPVIIMPGCGLCSNYNHSKYIPVLPIPKHMKDASSPFCICKKSDHQQCYQMSKSTNPWFPHTVEELVIWTVEREESVPFESVYKNYIPNHDSDVTLNTLTHLPSPPPPSSPPSLHKESEDSLKRGGQAAGTITEDLEEVDGSSASSRGSVNVSSNSPAIAARAASNRSSNRLARSGKEHGGSVEQVWHSDSGTDFHESSDPLQLEGSRYSGNETVIQTSVSGLHTQVEDSPPAPVSLFEDPLMQCSSPSTTSVQVADNSSDVGHDATLDYFPALRTSTDVASGNASARSTVSPEASTESKRKSVLDTTSARSAVPQRFHARGHPEKKISLQNRDFEGKAGVSKSKKTAGSAPATPLLKEEFDNSEHRKYRSSSSSAMPENWPDVATPPVGPSSGATPVTNCQEQANSPPQGNNSSTGAAAKPQTSKVDSSVTKTDGSSKQNGGPVDHKVASAPTASLDVNAKEFTPKTTMVKKRHSNQIHPNPQTHGNQPHPNPRFDPYQSSLNPNAVTYPYLTNGVPMPYVYYVPVGNMSAGGIDGGRRPTQLGPRPLCDSATSTSSGYSTTSENAISPTSPPSSPAFPHQCLLCYVAFPDLVSLRQHCKSALHVNTLLRDCGASTIWKHFPPPPGPPQLQFCPNGRRCTASRLNCPRPHFTEELREWQCRMKHRHNCNTTLPEFSAQSDGMLITPQEVEDVTQYSNLRVSVGEPLQAVLSDASDSFTWTITILGQNWQTLFGIHLKSSVPAFFNITDLEDATSQTSGKCQSDPANWVVNAPENGILLGQLSFSVRVTPDEWVKNYSCKVCLNLGFYRYAYICLALIVTDRPGTSKATPASSPIKPQCPPIRTDCHDITTTQREPQSTDTQNSLEGREPSMDIAVDAVSVDSAPAVESSSQEVKGHPQSQSSSAGDAGDGGGDAGGLEGATNMVGEGATRVVGDGVEDGSLEPREEDGVPHWQRSDSSGEDVTMETEDTAPYGEPTEDQSCPQADHLTTDDVTSSTDLHVPSNSSDVHV